MNTAMSFHDLLAYSLGLVELVDATLFRSEDVDDDDISTWEFRAPVASSLSWNSDASTCASPYQTPAQDVVYRYRAGLKVDLGERSSSSETDKSHATSFFDDSDSCSDLSIETSSTTSSFSLPFPAQQEVRPAFRESRANALLDIREEAIAVIKQDGLGEHDPVVCHRPDCRDTLPNMKALIYHLHIHNMHDRSYQCQLCGKRYESRRYLTMHPPIRDTFMRILTKITSRE
ncbi:hypothetical protein B0H13DRAFT_2041760 [Mycena leptocephala]|nr:hypothetical protein B0H13DRAFT_2041760 [Mycena leptocephala]